MHVVLNDQNWNWFCQWTCSCSVVHFRLAELNQQLAVHIFFRDFQPSVFLPCQIPVDSAIEHDLADQTCCSRSHAGLCRLTSMSITTYALCVVTSWYYIAIADTANMTRQISMIFHHWPLLNKWDNGLFLWIRWYILILFVVAYLHNLGDWLLLGALGQIIWNGNWPTPNLVNNFKMSFVFFANFKVVVNLTLNRFLVCVSKNVGETMHPFEIHCSVNYAFAVVRHMVDHPLRNEQYLFIVFCSWHGSNDWNWFQTVLCIWDRSVHLWINQPSTSKCMPCCPRGILIWMRAWSLRRPGTAESEMNTVGVLATTGHAPSLDLLRTFTIRSGWPMRRSSIQKDPNQHLHVVIQLWHLNHFVNQIAPCQMFLTKYNHPNLRARLRQLRQNTVDMYFHHMASGATHGLWVVFFLENFPNVRFMAFCHRMISHIALRWWCWYNIASRSCLNSVASTTAAQQPHHPRRLKKSKNSRGCLVPPLVKHCFVLKLNV